MITTKTLIETHANRYPDMRIDDYIKLFYQNSFGPRYMHDTPDEATLMAYITNELDAYAPPEASPEVEAIGHGYVRVSLSVVRDGKVTPEALAKAFRRSMEHAEGITDKTTTRFTCQLQTLLTMIDEGTVDVSDEDPHHTVETYLAGPIAPLRHSKPYRERYRPHYRVLTVKEADTLLGYTQGGTP